MNSFNKIIIGIGWMWIVYTLICISLLGDIGIQASFNARTLYKSYLIDNFEHEKQTGERD